MSYVRTAIVNKTYYYENRRFVKPYRHKQMKIINNFKGVVDLPKQGVKTRGEKVSIPPFFKKRLDRVLISENCLKLRIKEMAKEISKGKKEIYFISILKGSVVFLADLIRNINCDVKIDFISSSSYVGRESSGKIKINLCPSNLKGKDIFLLEDIVDTGNTLFFLKNYLFKKEKARTVKICALLDKPIKREKEIRVDIAGFSVPDYFVVGYGLDCEQQFRNLPFLAVIKNV